MSFAVPLITLAGGAFPHRVGASLLRAVGMDSLIVHSMREFEDLAVRLGSDRTLLHAVKSKLAGNIFAAPLFDSVKTTGDVERAVEGIWDAYQSCSGSRFFNIAIPERSGSTPNHALALADGMRAHQRGDVVEAVGMYRRILAQRPHDAEAWHLFGIASGSVSNVLRAASLHPRGAIYRSNAAHLLRDRGKHVEAEEQLIEAISIRMDAVPMRDARALCEDLISLMSVREAMELPRKVIEAHNVYIAPRDVLAACDAKQVALIHRSIATALRALGQTSDALARITLANEAFATYDGLKLHGVIAHESGLYNVALLRHLEMVRLQHRIDFAASSSRGVMQSKKAPRPKGKPVLAIYCHEYGQHGVPGGAHLLPSKAAQAAPKRLLYSFLTSSPNILRSKCTRIPPMKR